MQYIKVQVIRYWKKKVFYVIKNKIKKNKYILPKRIQNNLDNRWESSTGKEWKTYYQLVVQLDLGVLY